MRLGYNTNGLAHHDLFAAANLLSEIGYRSIAITLDHAALNPFLQDYLQQAERMRERLGQLGLSSVVETGARFLLDPHTKHEPTLLSAIKSDRERRIDFLCRSIDVAQVLGSDCVSLWSGVLRESVTPEQAFQRLIDSLSPVIEYADKHSVELAFEPEPGMFIDNMAQFDELQQRLNQSHLRLTLDIGHLHCEGEVPIAEYIRRWGSYLANVHIEDMRVGVHEHLMFGEGEIDFGPVIDALNEVGYQGGLHVELSRHSHDGPEVARRAYQFLCRFRSNDAL